MRKDLRREATVVQLLTINQVAAQLSVHRATVYTYIQNAGLPSVRIGNRSMRIDQADLNTWINQRKS